MSREKPVISAMHEDIISYEYSKYSKIVKVLIGTGTIDSLGQFTPNPNQNYEYITLSTEDFDELMKPSGAKPEGVFRSEDLWPFVDKNRIEKDTNGKPKNII